MEHSEHPNEGYFRSPTVHQDRVVFVCEDDLWAVALSGGRAQRLTNSRGEISHPHFSPDGQWLACCGREEGEDDVYVLPAQGGPLIRLTYINTFMRIVGWTRDGQHIIFMSGHQALHGLADTRLYMVPMKGGPVYSLPYGPAYFMDHGPQGKGVVIGRNTLQNFRWKRYRGGTIGEIWIDLKGNGEFDRLIPEVSGNPIAPLWIGERIYLVSDHEGIGNIYSCQLDGTALRQETFQTDFYVRHPSTDRKTLVYHAGGDLFALDLASHQEWKIEIQWHSHRVQLQRKFFYGDQYLEDIAIHPAGHSVAVVARGKVFAMYLWEHAVIQYGVRDGVRYREVRWLADERLIAITDEANGAEKLGVLGAKNPSKTEKLLDLPPGRVQTVVTAPHRNQLVFTNSRMELYWVDIDKKRIEKLDSSPIREISDVVFSPDGHWIAYTKHLTLELTAIFLINLDDRKVHQVTQPVRYDFAPAFDPEGRYLYFLSSRTYNPISDTVQMAAVFPRSVKPYLITLRRDLPNPFIPEPQAPGKTDDEERSEADAEPPSDSTSETTRTSEDATRMSVDATNEQEQTKGSTHKSRANGSAESKKTSSQRKKKKNASKVPPALEIHLDGIEQRIIEFPVSGGLFQQILGVPNKALFTEYPLLEDMVEDDEDDEEGLLLAYDFEKHELEELAEEVSWMDINASARTLLYVSGSMVRVVEAGVPVTEIGESSYTPNRKTGWLDLRRIRVSVDYASEWRQMFGEAWRLQKEFFWREDLVGVNWEQVYNRYAPLVRRLGSRSELSDLIWEMQGELGTSHAFEYGGDYHPSPVYRIGRLGADLEYDNRRRRYVFKRIYCGDMWRRGEHSPLCEIGVQVKEGDALLSIGGIPVDLQTPPGQLLVHQAGQDVILSIKSPGRKSKERYVMVKTLVNDELARYRDWVNTNRKQVDAATQGRVGYIHIPDMQAWGIAEFHRGYLSQTDKEGMIIDVRYNSGGMVSPLILEKLAHRHLGYDVPRWGVPEAYPTHTIRGHLLVIANEFTGSDGDMFCHSFRTLELGKILGKRTWGGVIGIDSRYRLVDGTVTTQPQFSAWFHDAGWSLENYGVTPDIEVEFPPQAYAQQEDPQLERAIQEVQRLLEEEPFPPLNFDPLVRPNSE